MSEKRYHACTTGGIALFAAASKRLPYSRTGALSDQGHVMRISEARDCTYDKVVTGETTTSYRDTAGRPDAAPESTAQKKAVRTRLVRSG